MEAHADHAHDHHHEMPTEGRALSGVAISATLHCLTGCAIGEVAGIAIGTALGFSDFGTIALAVTLAFTFGYTLTSIPLLRAGLTLSAVVPIALASDTLSIATMEVVDNVIMVVIPGAMDSGLGDILFWGALSFALAIAFVLTVPVNRWLLARGKGHTAVHETGIHGGPPTRLVGAATIAAFLFGSFVLAAEVIGDDDTGSDGAFLAAMAPHHESAIDMADIALERADHEEVTQLAESIVRTQSSELEEIDASYERLYNEPVAQAEHENLALSDEAMGMSMEVGALETAEPFDRAFIDMMIPHHQGAIRMARIELENGVDAESRQLAQDIIDAQSREIEEMNEWRERWYGSPSPAGGVPAESESLPEYSPTDE